MHILVVEDDKKIALFLKRSFEEEGNTVDLAFDGEEGVLRATSAVYDLVVMDVVMPKKDGLHATQEIRRKGVNVPILCLTAKDSPEEVVKGFKAGSDDYLAKPFSFAELNARCRALCRRKRKTSGVEIFYADLRLDTVSHKVWRSGSELMLTAKEYDLLEYFMKNPEAALTRSMIAKHVWNSTFDDSTNIIDVYVNYLRKKVDRRYRGKLIHTVRGVGYVLKENSRINLS